MFVTVVNIFAYIFDFLTTYIFYSQISRKKFKSVSCYLIGSVLFFVAYLVNIFGSNVLWFNLIFLLIANVSFGYLCYENKIKRVIFYSTILVTLSALIDFIVKLVFSSITSTSISALLYANILLVVVVSTSKILYFFMVVIFARLVAKDKQNRIPLSLCTYPISILVALVIFWYACAFTKIERTGQFALAAISMILLLPTIILFLTYQRRMEKENEIIELRNEMSKVETEMTYYDILERQNQDLLIYAHDTKNHLSAIKNLNTNPEIDKYIDKMSERLEIYKTISHSGNHILDVIINKYITECKIKDIKFSFDVRLKNLDYVEDYDLVTIMGNLLDNALESATNSQNREITLSTDYINTYDILIITNSCDKAPIHSNKGLVTTKKDKAFHGLGLKSVKKALKKYNGDYEWEYDEHNRIFTSVVMLSKTEK